MANKLKRLLCIAVVYANAISPAFAQNKESTANTVELPTQILRTGVTLNSSSVSPNSLQLANTMGLTPVIEKIQSLKSSGQSGLELFQTIQHASLLIQKANLEIDFTLAEINAELQIYDEILSKFTSDRDRLLTKINASSFISNGVLWAACEAMSIPSFNTNFAIHPRHVVQWPIPSGITGIAAGIVPSIASMYTLKAVNGKKLKSEVDPNMLAKLFGYSTTSDIEYPKPVWEYLNQVPADDPKPKKRLEQMIDRWVADANMPAFSDRGSKSQLDVITATVSQKKGLSISTLTARQVMLQQLSAEIMKMKRMLLELNMAVLGEKTL